MGCLKDKSDLDKENQNQEIKKVEESPDEKIVTKKPYLTRVRTNAEEFDLDSYKLALLKLHNKLREKHQSPELVENEELNDLASIYAESLVNDKKRNNQFIIYKGEFVGENIIISESKKPEDTFKKILDEIKEYDFNINKFTKKAGHFTQLIWKATTDIGCGFCADKVNSKYYTVLLYYPAGNILGKFCENILNEKIME